MPVNSDYKHYDLTRKIIGCAMKVHSYFGSGFPEVVYQRSLMIELERNGISATAQVEKVVTYYDAVVGKRRVDIIVEDRVLLELKAVVDLDEQCYNQVLNCLKVFRYEVGLLFNFGRGSLQYKRFARSIERNEDDKE
jgi:GxxExxY protein